MTAKILASYLREGQVPWNISWWQSNGPRTCSWKGWESNSGYEDIRSSQNNGYSQRTKQKNSILLGNAHHQFVARWWTLVHNIENWYHTQLFDDWWNLSQFSVCLLVFLPFRFPSPPFISFPVFDSLNIANILIPPTPHAILLFFSVSSTSSHWKQKINNQF